AVISPGEPFHMKDADRGYLMNWYSVRERGVRLFGPPSTTVIPPIAHDEFVRTVRDYIPWLGEWLRDVRDRKAQAYAILTMCRALYLHTTGEPAGKRRVALWAQQRLPDWAGLIRGALEWRAAWRETNVDAAATYGDTVRFVEFVTEQLKRPSP
ncbi:MAG: DUF4111 domain-containing protein, partial [Chloroflexi bacterium]|nr:DUF4111 domain-containing protein [Chloroflexota bacterium]